MHIYVDPSDPANVELVEPEDFRSFDIVLRGDGDCMDALARLGPVAAGGEHVFVEPARLLELAGARAGDSDWLTGLAKMTAFADSHGWVDEAGRLRAHVVR